MKTILKFRKILLVAVGLALATSVLVSQDRTRVYMGLRLPQMTTDERTGIGAEVNREYARGQMVFNINSGTLQYWTGTKWICLEDRYAILEFITNNFSTNLGDTILEYIINNISNEFVDSIFVNVAIGSLDTTITVVGSGTRDIDLSVNIDKIIEKLFADTTFIENLITTLVNDQEFIYQLISSNYFIDSLVTNITNSNKFIEQLVTNKEFIYQLISSNYFIDSLVTNITNSNKFIEQLVNKLTQHNDFITNLIQAISVNITENFVDSIMNLVTITGERGLEVSGSGTREITITLPDGKINGNILVWNNTDSVWESRPPESVVRQLIIPIDRQFSTENLIFHGETLHREGSFKVIGIEPFFENVTLRRNFLRVDASFQVVDGVVKWMVGIENRNFIPDNTNTLEHVVISYICSEAADLATDTQGLIQIGGF